jgi:hypothetical protein
LNGTYDALLKRLKYINEVEYRPACYKDFEEFEVDGKLYRLKSGTLRNKFSVLINEGRIERYYNSRASFFVKKGVRFGKQRAIQDMTELSISQLSEAIQLLPKESKGLHDIHTSFQVLDIWQLLSESRRFKVNEHNKGILLSPINIDGLKITANIHHTDTVTVTVACSRNPVSTKIDDVNGIVRLAAALGRTQERIQRIIDECGQSLPGGYETIPIPDSNAWMITMVHFAVDTPNYNEVKTCIAWKDAQGVLLREYNKKKEGTLRKERQVYPKICFNDMQKRFADKSSKLVFQSELELTTQ